MSRFSSPSSFPEHGPIRVPDAIEPLVGYREWHAWTDSQGRPVLMSLFHPSFWPHEGPMAATCLKSDINLWTGGARPPHPSPSEHCKCGIYAHLSADFEPYSSLSNKRYVTGIVSGWGRYILGTTGWRAEFARPIALLAAPGNEGWVARAADLYRARMLSSWPHELKAS